MTPLERLLLEELPTGTFGGTHPPADPPPREDLLTTTTAEEAAAHAAVLDREVAAYDAAHVGQRPAHRHLTPVPAQPQTATTRSAA